MKSTKIMKSKLAAVILCVLMIIMSFAGCASTTEESAVSAASDPTVTEVAADEETEEVTSEDEMFTDRDMDASYNESEASDGRSRRIAFEESPDSTGYNDG